MPRLVFRLVLICYLHAREVAITRTRIPMSKPAKKPAKKIAKKTAAKTGFPRPRAAQPQLPTDLTWLF